MDPRFRRNDTNERLLNRLNLCYDSILILNRIMTDQILEILTKLISFKSITPKSSGSIEYIAKLLQEAGFVTDIQIFGEKEESTTNLYAKYGDSVPNICFAGHVDVVPPMHPELWISDPFKLTIDEDKIYGRGAVDMKGAIAASMLAALNYLKTNKKPNGSISFLLTSDEEGGAKYGTKAMLEYLELKGEKIDFTILGEPTSEEEIGDTIKIGRRGSVNFDLTVQGKQGHVAYPLKAMNPVTSLVKIAADLIEVDFDAMRHCEEPQATRQSQEASSNLVVSPGIAAPSSKARNDESSFFNKTNLEITSIDVGNNVTNIIPETASMKFNVRFNDLHTSSSIAGIVMELIAKHEVIFDLKYRASAESFIQTYSARMKQFADIVAKECKLTPSIGTSGGTSDARFIHKYSQVVEFGLNSSEAHKINEHTKISDLQRLYNVYYTSLIEFFKG